MTTDFIATRDGVPYGTYHRSDEGSWQWDGEPGMPHLYGRVLTGSERNGILWGLGLIPESGWAEEFSCTWGATDSDDIELVPAPKTGSVFVPLRFELPIGTPVRFTPDGAVVHGMHVDGAPRSIGVLLGNLGLDQADGKVVSPYDEKLKITIVRLDHWIS